MVQFHLLEILLLLMDNQLLSTLLLIKVTQSDLLLKTVAVLFLPLLLLILIPQLLMDVSGFIYKLQPVLLLSFLLFNIALIMILIVLALDVKLDIQLKMGKYF